MVDDFTRQRKLAARLNKAKLMPLLRYLGLVCRVLTKVEAQA